MIQFIAEKYLATKPQALPCFRETEAHTATIHYIRQIPWPFAGLDRVPTPLRQHSHQRLYSAANANHTPRGQACSSQGCPVMACPRDRWAGTFGSLPSGMAPALLLMVFRPGLPLAHRPSAAKDLKECRDRSLGRRPPDCLTAGRQSVRREARRAVAPH